MCTPPLLLVLWMSHNWIHLGCPGEKELAGEDDDDDHEDTEDEEAESDHSEESENKEQSDGCGQSDNEKESDDAEESEDEHDVEEVQDVPESAQDLDVDVEIGVIPRADQPVIVNVHINSIATRNHPNIGAASNAANTCRRSSTHTVEYVLHAPLAVEAARKARADDNDDHKDEDAMEECPGLSDDEAVVEDFSASACAKHFTSLPCVHYRAVSGLFEVRPKTATCREVEYRWVPAHEGITDNELADKDDKAVAQRHSKHLADDLLGTTELAAIGRQTTQARSRDRDKWLAKALHRQNGLPTTKEARANAPKTKKSLAALFYQLRTGKEPQAHTSSRRADERIPGGADATGVPSRNETTFSNFVRGGGTSRGSSEGGFWR
ncbi:hypothetical protein FN846DRAFT_902438 [Sphaerosporella brunnea]|uniref:Uncharacterized protein n=1 Tax=Sphaerosporella brunnea TaxID=1250544 RepID=A0A5J5FAB6_9PEZI|nr:hypothetical protein FN846DRAFT_902438 [Sphaerosporella brunnea]